MTPALIFHDEYCPPFCRLIGFIYLLTQSEAVTLASHAKYQIPLTSAIFPDTLHIHALRASSVCFLLTCSSLWFLNHTDSPLLLTCLYQILH